MNVGVKLFKKYITEAFELSDDVIIDNSSLLEYNIKPRDILDIIPFDELKQFAILKQIKA